MTEALKEKIKESLRDGLPGADAHRKMMPAGRAAGVPAVDSGKPPVQSAVLVLLYPDDERAIRFPLIQRPKYDGAHSAQVSFPGGKAEPYDKDLVHTALREAEEEIGIHPLEMEVIGRLSEIYIWVSNFMVTPVVAITHRRPDFVKDDLEVDAIIEAKLHDLVNPERRKYGEVIAREIYKIQTPYFDIDGRIVWGATAMMLSELSELIHRIDLFK